MKNIITILLSVGLLILAWNLRISAATQEDVNSANSECSDSVAKIDFNEKKYNEDLYKNVSNIQTLDFENLSIKIYKIDKLYTIYSIYNKDKDKAKEQAIYLVEKNNKLMIINYNDQSEKSKYFTSEYFKYILSLNKKILGMVIPKSINTKNDFDIMILKGLKIITLEENIKSIKNKYNNSFELIKIENGGEFNFDGDIIKFELMMDKYKNVNLLILYNKINAMFVGDLAKLNLNNEQIIFKDFDNLLNIYELILDTKNKNTYKMFFNSSGDFLFKEHMEENYKYLEIASSIYKKSKGVLEYFKKMNKKYPEMLEHNEKQLEEFLKNGSLKKFRDNSSVSQEDEKDFYVGE